MIIVNNRDKIDGSNVYRVIMINGIMRVKYMYRFEMGRRRKRTEVRRDDRDREKSDSGRKEKKREYEEREKIEKERKFTLDKKVIKRGTYKNKETHL